jgi:hypothetical protein
VRIGDALGITLHCLMTLEAKTFPPTKSTKEKMFS